MACKRKIKARKMDIGGLLGNPILSSILGLTQGIIQDNQNINNYGTNQQQGSLYNFNNTNTPLMPNGGYIPNNNSETVELEKGEPFMYPNGNMGMISNNAPTHKQGGVPITLPEGTKVLGKKNIYNDKTFKEMGAKLKRKGDKYRKILEGNSTKIEERTANMMLNKLNKEFDALFNMQEETSSSYKMPNGGVVQSLGELRKQAQENIMPYHTTDTYSYSPEQIRQAEYNDIISQRPFYNPTDKSLMGYERYRKGMAGPTYNLLNTEDTNSTYKLGEKKLFPGSELPTFSEGGLTRKKDYGSSKKPYPSVSSSDFAGGKRSYPIPTKADAVDALRLAGLHGRSDVKSKVYAKYPSLRKGQYGLETFDPTKVLDSSYNIPSYQQPAMTSINYPNEETNYNKVLKKAIGGNNNYLSLLPVGYNLIQGLQSPDYVSNNAFRNPYENTIRSTMANRRYNVEPELEANRLAENTYYRNLREAAPSQAQLLGGLQVGQINTNRANAGVYANQQNMNNQYLAQQAQVDMQLGTAESNRQRYVEDINAQTKANASKVLGAGLSQLGQYSQNRKLMGNQMIRDAQKMGILNDLIKNFSLNNDGTWSFKGSNEKLDEGTVWDYITGKNIK